jgi:uncharacterized protein YhbP (UPF0306 family)
MPALTVRLANLRTVDAGGRPLRVGRRSEKRVRSSVRSILERTPLCSLATVDSRGRAHSSHVYFAYSAECDIYFMSDPNSKHCRHLRNNPSMAISVYDSRQRWGRPDRGVAFHGVCREATGRRRADAESVYGRRFPAYRAWRRTVRPGDAASKWRFFRFVARRVKIFDEPRLGTGVFVTASVRGKDRRAT